MRQRSKNLHVGVIAAALAAAALGACKRSGDYASTDTSAMRSGNAAGAIDSLAPSTVRTDSTATTGKWAAASVLGFMVQANDGEIALGKVGERMATNAQVKAFARMLVTDHEKLLAGSKQLAKQVSATPDLNAGDVTALKSYDADEFKHLSGRMKGAEWDKEFINQVIDGHQKVLSQLQDAAKNTQDASMQRAIEKATGIIQQHLTKAQDIKTNVLKD